MPHKSQQPRKMGLLRKDVVLRRLHHEGAGAELGHDTVSVWLELAIFALQFAVLIRLLTLQLGPFDDG